MMCSRKKETELCTLIIGYRVVDTAAHQRRHRHAPGRLVYAVVIVVVVDGSNPAPVLLRVNRAREPLHIVLLGSFYLFCFVVRGFSSLLLCFTLQGCCFTWGQFHLMLFLSSGTALLPALFTGAPNSMPSFDPKWSLIIPLLMRYQQYGKIPIEVVNGDHALTNPQEVHNLENRTYLLSSLVCCFPESNGYLYIEANGGLNQQRTSICNAVAVAGYLNAVLVIPHFHFHSIWRDPSKFGDIYDEDFFVKTLANDVRVVNKVPDYIMQRFDYNMSNVYNFRIKAWSSIGYYRDTVLPKLLEEKLIRISPFANRLSFDSPPAVQRLRCLANYEALRFSSPILSLGETLVSRMKERSANNSGKYISVHLRFEEDMVAFSCCIYDGDEEEKKDMDAARERGWKGKFTKPGRVIRPGAIRINGKCPLTPLEVGLMLRGMGFDKITSIYLASGKIYDSERHMKPLLEMFPLLQTKEMLASPEELAPFQNYSSRMAAIDYTVCLHSEVFVTTQGGNFPHFLLGHRRYLYGGHSRTIRPDKRKLALLYDNPNIGWRSFKRQMLNIRAHSDSKGIEIKRPNDSIYSFPCPDCMCRSNKTEDSRSSSVT